MRKDLIVPGEQEEKHSAIPQEARARVVTEQFTPLEERIAKEQPHMLESLLKLKESMGVEEFDKYINCLQSLRRNETTVMLVTDKQVHRTNIEAKYIPHIEKAFNVNFVRVVAI